MGTINYKTSNYITMGVKPYDEADFLNDADFMRELQAEVNEYGGTIDDAIRDYIQVCYESDIANVECALEKHSFNYFHIVICYGYYEGFSLNIENNYPIALDGYEDRRLANKEITELKQLLIECAGFGLVSCYPGWCTGYRDYSGTLADIQAAVKAMRDEIASTTTWLQYERTCS